MVIMFAMSPEFQTATLPAADTLSLNGHVELDAPALYINRELSLLEFQRRVLEEALDTRNPLLERVRFVSILASNLDEFFMVRVGGLMLQIGAGVTETGPDGLTPGQQLAAVRKLATELMAETANCFTQLLPELAASRIFIHDYTDLSGEYLQRAQDYFAQIVFPVLTPLAFDPGHPFPHISNLSLNLAVEVRRRDGQRQFARVKIPDTLPRLVPLRSLTETQPQPAAATIEHHFVWMEQLIAANASRLFPGTEIIGAHAFHVTRNADMNIQEHEAGDLLETMEQSVRERRFGDVVRLCLENNMSEQMRTLLLENLEVNASDAYGFESALDLHDIEALAGLEQPALKYPTFVPSMPAGLRDASMFRMLAQAPLLVHHPYDSFQSVLQFFGEAASDPDVLAIKQTMYRMGSNSPVVQALLHAQENHKQVAVLVELKARFDEVSNIGWARTLENEGVHVTYGLMGLKTHCKIVLVVRREGARIRRYLHLGTGNYNAGTAQVYEDFGLFTCDEEMGADASELFNYLTGYAEQHSFRKLLVAPVNMRSGLTALIAREIEHQRAGRGGHLILKTNALTDQAIIQQLYTASQNGVQVDLLVRGICCLRPGVPGISDNIRVCSVLGRFLEHSRMYYFLNGGEETVYLGSADLMARSLDRRVELLFPVEDAAHKRYLRDTVLQAHLADNTSSRSMQPNGEYRRNSPHKGAALLAVQDQLLAMRTARPAAEVPGPSKLARNLRKKRK